MSDIVIYKKEGSVAQIIMNQPKHRNSLNNEMIEALISALKKADEDSEVNSIVLTGTGDAFSAGGDLGQFSEFNKIGAVAHHDSGIKSTDLFRMGHKLRKPLIAAINGFALGGGCGLAAMAHITIAADNAKLGTTEIKVGLFPLVILPLIERAVGRKKALELGLTGDILDAKTAESIGLVNKVVPKEHLMEETMKMAETIASRSPVAVKIGLDAINKTDGMEFHQSLDYLNTLRVISFMSEDLVEGASAFIEKREPNWKGR